MGFTCLQQGFIAQLVEYCNSITEVMGSNSFEASEFSLEFLCNYLSKVASQLRRSLSLVQQTSAQLYVHCLVHQTSALTNSCSLVTTWYHCWF